MTNKINIKVSQEQYDNWTDFRFAESIIPANSKIQPWDAVDIIRLRRKGEDYKSIVMITGLSENMVRNVCQRANMGRGYIQKWRMKKMICPYCKERRIAKVGKIASVKDGKKQRFQCRECGRTFYGKDKEEQ